ncbi:MAG: histidine kinase, partial [Leucobacter sp.]
WESHVIYLLAIGLAYYVLLDPDVAAWQWVMQTVLAPFAIAAVVLRKRFPYALTLVGAAALFAGTVAVVVIGLVSLAIRRQGVLVWLTALGVSLLCLATVFRRLFEQPWHWVVQTVPVMLVFTMVLPVLVGRFIRRSREREVAATARAVRAEVEREVAAARAVDAERERIARDMHDSLGHVLTLVTTQAGALEVSTRDPAARAAAEAIRNTARRGLADLRAVVRALGEADADRAPMPTLTAVLDLIAESRAAGASVELDDGIGVEQAEVQASIGRLVYRIVQESLTNAHRHAPGAPTRVSLRGSPGSRLEVVVGNPLAPGGQRGGGTGLEALRGRVEVLGGRFEARSARGRFELRADLPWEDA